MGPRISSAEPRRGKGRRVVEHRAVPYPKSGVQGAVKLQTSVEGELCLASSNVVNGECGSNISSGALVERPLHIHVIHFGVTHLQVSVDLRPVSSDKYGRGLALFVMSGACSTVGVFSGINNLHISIFMSGAWDFDDAHPGTGRCMRVETFEHLDRGSIAVECNSYHDDDGIVILSVSTLVNPLAVAIPSMGSMGHGQLDLLLSLLPYGCPSNFHLNVLSDLFYT
ncbi:hypothetical protein Taro_019377 [Colocasia esculenta]|uniref:Uncharacterized protein n=1 Tax=Colocasia esculenta TaxID=4460 RepID=A0A843UTB4_COLES|nr:hypothetical protein [Colocasia esculenta]